MDLSNPLIVAELRALLERLTAMSPTRPARKRDDLIRTFVALVRCGNVTPKYVLEVERYLQRMIPTDITIDRVSSVEVALAISAFDANPRAKAEAASILRRFFAWLVKEGDIHRDPTDTLAVKRIAVRIARRALTQEEQDRLTSPSSPIPLERATLYLVAVSTGLRMGRLWNMRWRDVDWTKGNVRYRTKGGKNKSKPIPAATLTRLRGLFAVRKLEDKVFSSVPSPRTFRRDLERVGIEFETPEGRMDRHALRTTFCTRLGERGVNLQTAQALMDHSDPRVTARIYTRLPSEAERRAVERISTPRMSRSEGPRHATP